MYEEQLPLGTAIFKSDYTQLYCSMGYGIKIFFSLCTKEFCLRASSA